MINQDNLLHAFKTFMGMPPDTDDQPVCGATITKDYNGKGKAKCDRCAELVAQDRAAKGNR